MPSGFCLQKRLELFPAGWRGPEPKSITKPSYNRHYLHQLLSFLLSGEFCLHLLELALLTSIWPPHPAHDPAVCCCSWSSWYSTFSGASFSSIFRHLALHSSGWSYCGSWFCWWFYLSVKSTSLRHGYRFHICSGLLSLRIWISEYGFSTDKHLSHCSIVLTTVWLLLESKSKKPGAVTLQRLPVFLHSLFGFVQNRWNNWAARVSRFTAW